MRPGSMRTILVLLTASSVPVAAAAQDAHYWTYQYGDRAALLGGTVVGSAVDLSAVYYNPGALALLERPDLIAAARTLELASVRISGTGTAGYDANEDRFSVAPGFFAGLIPLHALGRHRLGYSLLTRHRFRLRLNTSEVGVGDVLDPPVGAEDLLGTVRLDAELNETWGGLTWAMPLGGTVGIGVSQYVAARGQRSSSYLLAEIFDTAGVAQIGLVDEGYEYYSYRTLWKVGVAARWSHASVGLTATTPSVRIFGSGKHETNVTGFDAAAGSGAQVFVADFQEKRAATYRSPLSVAAGASWALGATRLHAAAEWFGGEDEADVLDLVPYIGQSTGDTVVPRVTQKSRPVVNIGLGVEQHFDAETRVYASVRTDRSAAEPVSGSNVSITSWDIYFLTFGASFRMVGASVTLGVGYGFGSQAQQLDPPSEGGLLPDTVDTKYRNYRLFFALAF